MPFLGVPVKSRPSFRVGEASFLWLSASDMAVTLKNGSEGGGYGRADRSAT